MERQLIFDTLKIQYSNGSIRIFWAERLCISQLLFFNNKNQHETKTVTMTYLS